MAIKVLFVSLITSLIAVGCVALPDDGYDARGYDQRSYGYNGYPVYRNNDDRYNNRYDHRYDRNNDRDRWERERAYRLQQARKEQDIRQYQLKKQYWQLEQAKRQQAKKQPWQHQGQDWNKRPTPSQSSDSKPNKKQWQQHNRHDQQGDKKPDNRKNKDQNTN